MSAIPSNRALPTIGRRGPRRGRRLLGVGALLAVAALVATARSSSGSGGGGGNGGGSSGSTKGKTTYSFGVLAPLTGGTAAFGAEWKRAIDMWSASYNASHTKTAVSASYADSKCLAASGVTGMSQLVHVDKVSYVVTGCSSVVKAIHTTSEQSKVIVMNQGGQSPDLILKGYTFNAIPLITLELKAMIPSPAPAPELGPADP